jgi:hypothetical protein
LSLDVLLVECQRIAVLPVAADAAGVAAAPDGAAATTGYPKAKDLLYPKYSASAGCRIDQLCLVPSFAAVVTAVHAAEN